MEHSSAGGMMETRVWLSVGAIAPSHRFARNPRCQKPPRSLRIFRSMTRPWHSAGRAGSPAPPGCPTNRSPARPPPARAFPLDSMDPGEKPFSLGEKALDQAAMDSLAVDIDALQNLFYVDKRYKLLVVLQGTDTAGKDGTIRSVFARTSALGVH